MVQPNLYVANTYRLIYSGSCAAGVAARKGTRWIENSAHRMLGWVAGITDACGVLHTDEPHHVRRG